MAQALSIGGWVLATVVTRHLLGSHVRPLQYHGVLGWVSWDGGFYRLITEQGYASTSPESIRFFPLYPMLAKLVRLPLGGQHRPGAAGDREGRRGRRRRGHLRLVTLEGGSDRLARRSIWCWVLFPGAFVLSWAYSEALLVALAAWCIWALRTKRWMLAALLALLAGLCRPIGLALAAAALVEVLRDRHAVPWRSWLARSAAVLAAPVGAIGVLRLQRCARVRCLGPDQLTGRTAAHRDAVPTDLVPARVSSSATTRSPPGCTSPSSSASSSSSSSRSDGCPPATAPMPRRCSWVPSPRRT